MNALNPISLLVQTLSLNESFTEGSKKIASLIRRNEEQCEASLLADSLLNGVTDSTRREYILFSLLDVSRADFDILERAVQLRQLRRLIAKATYLPGALNDNEVSVCSEIHREFHLSSIDHVVYASNIARKWVRKLMNDHNLDDQQRRQLALLITSEAIALKERIMRLSDRVDSYDMHAIAQLLPLLTICDEQAGALTELGERIRRHDRLGRVVLTFEYAMGSDNFKKWMEQVGQQPSLREFFELIRLQQTRLVPMQTLIASATLSRRLHKPETPPLTWVGHALKSCTTSGFRMDAGPGIETAGPILAVYDPFPSEATVSGASASDENFYLIESDMLTRQKEDDAAEPPPGGLVSRRMRNDAQLLRLIENAKVFETRAIHTNVAELSGSSDDPSEGGRPVEAETAPPRGIRIFRQMTVPVIARAITAALLIATVTFFIFNIRQAYYNSSRAVSRRQVSAPITGKQVEHIAATVNASSTPPAPFENPSILPAQRTLPGTDPAAALRRKSPAASSAYTLAALEALVDAGNLSTALRRLKARTVNDGAYYSLYARCLYESGEWEKAYEAAEMSTRVPSGRITERIRMGQYLLYKAKYLSVQNDAAPSREAAQSAIDAWWKVREHFDGAAENAKAAFAESEIINISKILRN